ncbi:hypothetical protein [Rubritalea tangerina]|uniref:hypothetical protein n=1 Tax=Rubritalea tangerina TaxID=430798 RepID=UPI00361B6F27
MMQWPKALRADLRSVIIRTPAALAEPVIIGRIPGEPYQLITNEGKQTIDESVFASLMQSLAATPVKDFASDAATDFSPSASINHFFLSTSYSLKVSQSNCALEKSLKPPPPPTPHQRNPTSQTSAEALSSGKSTPTSSPKSPHAPGSGNHVKSGPSQSSISPNSPLSVKDKKNSPSTTTTLRTPSPPHSAIKT